MYIFKPDPHEVALWLGSGVVTIAHEGDPAHLGRILTEDPSVVLEHVALFSDPISQPFWPAPNDNIVNQGTFFTSKKIPVGGEFLIHHPQEKYAREV